MESESESDSNKHAQPTRALAAGARIVTLFNSLPPKTKETLTKFATSWLQSPRKGVKPRKSARASEPAPGVATPWVAAGVLGGMALWYLGTRHRDEPRAPFVPGSNPGRIRHSDPTMRL